MSYSPYYTGGWQTGETGGTPITPAALNHMDSGIGANAAAAAEQAEDISDVNALLGNTSMGTTATTVTGAIKEHSNKIGNTALPTTAQTLTGAIAEHEADLTALNGNLANLVGYKTVEVGTVTILSGGYLNLSGYRPATPTGYRFMFAMINSYTSETAHAAFTVTDEGTWLIGTGGDTITGLKVDYFFIKMGFFGPLT